MEKKSNPIPYVGCLRVGNYRLWRSKINKGTKKAVDAIFVADAANQWQTRVVETSTMYASIMDACNGADEAVRDGFLEMLFTNMFRVCTMASVPLHDGFSVLCEMLTLPYLLLPKRDMKKRLVRGLKKAGMKRKERKAHVSKMLEYRKDLYKVIDDRIAGIVEDYERSMDERLAAEPEAEKAIDHDEVAEQAFAVLEKE